MHVCVFIHNKHTQYTHICVINSKVWQHYFLMNCVQLRQAGVATSCSRPADANEAEVCLFWGASGRCWCCNGLGVHQGVCERARAEIWVMNDSTSASQLLIHLLGRKRSVSEHMNCSRLMKKMCKYCTSIGLLCIITRFYLSAHH